MWSGGAMYPRIRTIIAEARLDSGGGGGYDSSSGGGSSSGSPGASESDGSSSPDEFYCPHDPRELLRRHGSPLSVRGDDDADREVVSASSPRVLDDVHRHQQRMLLLLPAFAASDPAVAAERAEALSCWLSGFGVGWVLELELDASGDGLSLPRMELGQLGRRVSAWAQALSTMERVFRLQLQDRELAPPAQVAAMEELAVASAGAMLKPVGAVAALGLGSSPTTLLTALDLYAPVSETYPALARLFSWGPSHPLSAAADAALAALVDAALRCRRGLAAFVRSYCPWPAPEGSDVHPCVGFWMGYFLCLLRNRVSLVFILGSDDDDDCDAEEGGVGGVVAELISRLEAVVEETSAALDSAGLRQVFMLNNTHAIVRRAVDSGLEAFLPADWTRVREQSVEGYIRGYMDASWTPVVSRLVTAGGAKKSPVSRRRRNPLSAFYSAFDNACGAQRCWKVPDPVLRGVLRETVAEHVVPTYRRYLEDHPEVEVAGGRAAEELEKQLTDLFEG